MVNVFSGYTQSNQYHQAGRGFQPRS